MNKFTINLHRWITAVLLLSLSPSIFAQGNEDVLDPCYSFWYNYNNIREKTSHVRSDHDYRVIHTQYRNLSSDIMVHTFAILRYSTNVENHFTTTFGAIEPSDPTVDINDMEIYNGICYFCGTKTFNSPNPNYTIPVQKGIVGCFSISAMYSGLGSLVTYEVPGTTQLTRLAISCPSQQLAQINAIGIMDDFSSSCLVEIRENSSTSWTATLDYLPSIPKIHFSDILATHNSIILLSQLKCANDHFYGADDYDINHQKFLLDRFSWNGCHDDCTASYTTHYMAHYQLNTFENYYFHYNKAPMALSRLADDWFSVAFGVIKNGSGSGGIRFFPFQNICGYLVVRLYGNAKVEEVLLEGNNGEVLSGECSVIIESSTNLPFIVWNKSGFTQTWISVANKVNNVVTPLELGKTAAEANHVPAKQDYSI